MVQVNAQNWPLGQIAGTQTNDTAAAGFVGQELTASATAVSISTATAKTVISISLTAGDWDLKGLVQFNAAGTTSITYLIVSFGTADNTRATTYGQESNIPLGSGTVVGSNAPYSVHIGPYRVSLAATTTVYLVVQSAFATSTLTADGYLRARRIR